MTTDDKTTEQQDKDAAAPGAAEVDEAALWEDFDKQEADAGGDADQPSEKDREDSKYAAGVDDDPAAKDDPADSAADSAADADDDGDKADTDKGEKPGGDKPSGKTAKDTTLAKLWSSATPEQKAAYQTLEEERHRLGRDMASLRQVLGRHKARIAELESAAGQQKVSRETKDSPASDAGKEADALFASDDWKKAEEEYGDVLGPVKNVVNALLEKVSKVETGVGAIYEERASADIAYQENMLREKHADYDTVIRSNIEAFRPWISAQPRHIREAFARNQEQVVDAEEAADVVARFKQHIGLGEQQQTDSGKGAGQADAGNGTTTKATTHLSDKRKRQLDSATDARSRGPGAVSTIPEDADEETIWKAFDAKEAQERRRVS